MKYTNRADLLIAAGESIKMQEASKIEPVCKSTNFNCGRTIMPIEDASFTVGFWQSANYEFPLAVVEGRAVFVGDELYHCCGKCKVVGKKQFQDTPETLHFDCGIYGYIRADQMSFTPPKSATVMVELLREDAEFIIRVYGDCSTGSHAGNCAQACRKALEEK